MAVTGQIQKPVPKQNTTKAVPNVLPVAFFSFCFYPATQAISLLLPLLKLRVSCNE